MSPVWRVDARPAMPAPPLRPLTVHLSLPTREAYTSSAVWRLPEADVFTCPEC